MIKHYVHTISAMIKKRQHPVGPCFCSLPRQQVIETLKVSVQTSVDELIVMHQGFDLDIFSKITPLKTNINIP